MRTVSPPSSGRVLYLGRSFTPIPSDDLFQHGRQPIKNVPPEFEHAVLAVILQSSSAFHMHRWED